MLKEKTVQVIDAEKYPKGTFVTFCYTKKGDDGELVHGNPLNAIVSKATEDAIYVTHCDGASSTISLDSLILDTICVLGVRENAL